LLATLLRELRGDRPVDDVAKALGVARSAIYLWESTNPGARRLPSPPNLRALLDHYGASDEQRARAWDLRSRPDGIDEDEIPTLVDPTPVP
jgi:hypothetical protein